MVTNILLTVGVIVAGLFLTIGALTQILIAGM